MDLRRTPLLLIGASAGVAVWSGWVGLGELTGFGVVKPLPGITDFEINTAITLPLGIEAYAVMALGTATSEKNIPVKARRFAWVSAILALLLGMIAQVSFHLIEGGSKYPLLTIFVASIPVLVLGIASVLWHLSHPVSDVSPQVDTPDVQPTVTEVKPTVVIPAPVAEPVKPVQRALPTSNLLALSVQQLNEAENPAWNVPQDGESDLDASWAITRELAGGNPYAIPRDKLAVLMRKRIGSCPNGKASLLLNAMREQHDGRMTDQ